MKRTLIEGFVITGVIGVALGGMIGYMRYLASGVLWDAVAGALGMGLLFGLLGMAVAAAFHVARTKRSGK